MASSFNPYLNFRESTREAMEFYQSVFGGELTTSSFAEFGMADAYPGEGEKIMHSRLATPSGFILMAADVPSTMPLAEGSTISVSLSGDDEAELRGYWDKLSDGATIVEPLTQAPWGDQFGMLNDRFGTAWLVNISAPAA